MSEGRERMTIGSIDCVCDQIALELLKSNGLTLSEIREMILDQGYRLSFVLLETPLRRIDLRFISECELVLDLFGTQPESVRPAGPFEFE